jgi:hypothetical protein
LDIDPEEEIEEIDDTAEHRTVDVTIDTGT